MPLMPHSVGRPFAPAVLACAAGQGERTRRPVVPGSRRRGRGPGVAEGRETRSCVGNMQSASDTASSHRRRAVAQADRPRGGQVVPKPRPGAGRTGAPKVVAKERVRPAAGAPGRIHERHATLLLCCEAGQVTFRYTDNRGASQTRTLAGADFLWLLLQHVLPKGLRRTRDYGFLHANRKRLIQLLQLLLRVCRPPTKPRLPLCCKHCGGVVTVAIFPFAPPCPPNPGVALGLGMPM